MEIPARHAQGRHPVNERLSAALADRYRIERELGAGGMATVYLAQDLKHDRKVALKVLKPELAAVLGAERFVVEIKTTAALQHPHILPLFDSGTADGFLYYVMPYIQGETLRSRLDRETQLDGGSVAFITGFPGALKIARMTGGAPTTLVPDSAWADGLAWGDDGWIYYPARQATALMRVRAAGGAAELVAQADTAKDELFLYWPTSLPGGQALLVTVWRKRAAPDVAVLDLATKQLQVLLGGVRALYAPTGHLVVLQGDGTVVAVPFNPRKLTLSGRPTPVLEGLRVPQGGKTFFAFSANGTLLYDASRPVWEVVRVARDGTAGLVDQGWIGEFSNLALSPDGSRLAIGITNQGRDEIWVKTLNTGPLTRIASAGSRNARPVWLPDGRSVSFTSDVEASYQLFRAAADGSGAMQLALSFSRSIDEAEWSRDGRWLVIRGGSGSGRHLYGIRPGVDSQPHPLARTEFEEFSPTLSPDGRWLAFASTASGKDEVYVQPFPNTESGKYQISPADGTEPLWSHSGRELFYRNERGNLVAAAIHPGAAFHVSSQRVLFAASSYLTDTRSRNYAVSPDDRSFYFVRAKVVPANTYVVVLNWFAELKAKVGK